MTIGFNITRRDGSIYRQWARWMLGVDYGPGGPLLSSMMAADAIYRQESAAIERVAATLRERVLSRVWGPEPTRTLYRGLRLEDPQLHDRPMPADPRYERIRAFSFTEDRDVACFFADTGAEGMLALPIHNPATGKVGLPPHGYVATGAIPADAVLLHWRYVLGIPGFITANPDDLRMVRWQQEVTVRAHPPPSLHLRAFHASAADYIARRYDDGVWTPAPPPFNAG